MVQKINFSIVTTFIAGAAGGSALTSAYHNDFKSSLISGGVSVLMGLMAYEGYKKQRD